MTAPPHIPPPISPFRRPVSWMLVSMVRLYQLALSPWFGGHCKYLPTCSAYFIEAVARKGALKGLLLGVWRILRCNPFSHGGYDPVK